MNQDIREQLSALIDNELDRDRTRFLLKRAEHDVELVALWQRWHLAGEVLRGAALPLRQDFLSGIHTQLEADLAGQRPLPSRHGMVRWAGGFAVAASVALAALLLVQPPPATTPILEGNEVASDLPVNVDVPVASVVAPSPYRVQDLRPPYRLDAQAVSAYEAGRSGTQSRFDPGYEAYWLRHQHALSERTQTTGQTPWLSPLRPDLATASPTP